MLQSFAVTEVDKGKSRPAKRLDVFETAPSCGKAAGRTKLDGPALRRSGVGPAPSV